MITKEVYHKSAYHATYYQNNKDKLKYKAKWRKYNTDLSSISSKLELGKERHKVCFITKQTIMNFD